MLKTVVFIEKWHLVFLYIGLIDWVGGGGGAFDRHGIVGTGAGHLLTNNAC